MIVLISGSVALLADTVHNFSDALTAVPLWIAFLLGRRRATRTYTYGFGRAEDLAGLFIVAMIALSAVVAAVESIRRFFEPQPVHNLGWVLAAGLVGFAGNELVAIYRIRVGRRIGSAALVADGVHARTDGFTSLAVVAGVIGIWLGFPAGGPDRGPADFRRHRVLLWGTVRDVGRRLMDGVDPDLTDRRVEAVVAEHSRAGGTARLRWSGHRLHVEITVPIPTDAHLVELASVTANLEARHPAGPAARRIGDDCARLRRGRGAADRLDPQRRETLLQRLRRVVQRGEFAVVHGGVQDRRTPPCPTTLGRDSATPVIPYWPSSTVDTGRTAFSARSRASTMRAPERPIA